MQIPAPSLPPGFVSPPSGFIGFVMLYVLFEEIVLLALPRTLSNRILETLFPALRRML
jgi:hypothetical protein